MHEDRRPLKGALIGFGFIAERGHFPAYAAVSQAAKASEGGAAAPLEIVAIADISPERQAVARRLAPNARVYSSAEALFAAEPSLDFVDISTPPCDHAKLALAAFAQGLHVLCEKPLAVSGAEALAMAEAARGARRVLFPCHNYKHAPVIKRVRALLNENAIGPVRLVTLQTFRTTHAKGVSEWRTDWRRDGRTSGGGIAMDHGSHTFYLAFDWLGSYPSAITAKMSTLGSFDTEDNFSCTITFPKALVAAHLTWTAGTRKVIYTLQGELGAIRVEDDDIEVSRAVGGNPSTALRWDVQREQISSDWMDSSHVHWFASLLGDFYRAIGSDTFVGKEAQDSIRCVELITTAYASAREGCRELPLRGE